MVTNVSNVYASVRKAATIKVSKVSRRTVAASLRGLRIKLHTLYITALLCLFVYLFMQRQSLTTKDLQVLKRTLILIIMSVTPAFKNGGTI